jgi:uncharacterized lipoprotein YbaY
MEKSGFRSAECCLRSLLRRIPSIQRKFPKKTWYSLAGPTGSWELLSGIDARSGQIDRLPGNRSLPTMKILLSALALCVLWCAGCGHFDTTPQPVGDRTLSGKVNIRSEVALAPGAVVTVRLLDVSQPDAPGKVLDEQTITTTGNPAVAFRLAYKAEDIQPPKRARIDARLAVDGKLRFYTVTAYPVTPGNADAPFDLWLDSASR